MSSERLWDELEGHVERRLGGSARRPPAGAPAAQLFDLALSPAVAPVWSIVYEPVFVPSPFGLGTLVHSNETIGRVQFGGGGARPAVMEFDWGQGGVLQVPAGQVQLSAFLEAAMATDPSNVELSAFAVPAVLGRTAWQQNTRTYELGVPPTGAPALTLPVPPYARSWSMGAAAGGAAAGVLEVFVLASDGTTLELWNRDFPANNLGGPLEDQHVLPRRASVFSVLQSALSPAAISRVQFRFLLAL
jgi:hypothetical protein